MTPRKRKRSCWRFAAGERGYTVEVCERTPGGVLYAKVWDAAKGHQVYLSLKHRDQERARQYAREESEKLRLGRSAVRAGVVTVGQLLDLYFTHRTPEKKSAESRDEDTRRVEMWTRVLGSETPAADVTLDDWYAFKAKRASGAIDPRGNPVRKPSDRRACGPVGIAADGKFIRSVYYWGMSWRVKGGATLVAFNPFGAPAKGVKSAFVLPRNPKPARPLASDERYELVRAVAHRVLMPLAPHRRGLSSTAVQVTVAPRPYGRYGKMVAPKRWMERSYLYELLALAWETGRRREAWLMLRANDLRWGTVEESGRTRRGIVAIYWRAIKHDEEGALIPVSADLRRVLEAFLAEWPLIGDVPLFASAKIPTQPVNASTADEWLLEAEAFAKVPHLERGRWHPYRRGWATKRKAYPTPDVMKGGGWKSEKVLKTIYQQSDDQTLNTMINEPARLEERKAK